MSTHPVSGETPAVDAREVLAFAREVVERSTRDLRGHATPGNVRMLAEALLAASRTPEKPERVRHFKGEEYTVIGSGYATGKGVPDVMVYMDKRGVIWVRPMVEWFEPVEWSDGVTRPRFVPVERHPSPTSSGYS